MKRDERPMGRLAIAGAGMTGTFLFRLLTRAGHDVDLFDRRPRTRCGLKPCAWGTSTGFGELVRRAGLDAEKYILRRLDHLVMDGVSIRADVMTFDKPRLIQDLLGDAEIHPAPVPIREYDRVIDATGGARALLPPISGDVTLVCREYLIEAEEPIGNYIKLGGVGYAWRFPLAENLCHVGCGSLRADPDRVLAELGWLNGRSGAVRVRCGCTGTIRLTGPHGSQPFVTGGCAQGVWGVGEAIGCVAPLAGDGVVPGMRSVELLLQHWGDPRHYTRAVLTEFAWMDDERGVVDKLRKNEALGLGDARVLKRNAKRMEMRVGLREALALLFHLR
jgi:flavin-dependent dehydrogenase